MLRTIAFITALSVASATVALPAQAAQARTSSATSGIGSLISSLLNFRVPTPPPPPPPPSPGQVANKVCSALILSWLVNACRGTIGGGPFSP